MWIGREPSEEFKLPMRCFYARILAEEEEGEKKGDKKERGEPQIAERDSEMAPLSGDLSECRWVLKRLLNEGSVVAAILNHDEQLLHKMRELVGEE